MPFRTKGVTEKDGLPEITMEGSQAGWKVRAGKGGARSMNAGTKKKNNRSAGPTQKKQQPNNRHKDQQKTSETAPLGGVFK